MTSLEIAPGACVVTWMVRRPSVQAQTAKFFGLIVARAVSICWFVTVNVCSASESVIGTAEAVAPSMVVPGAAGAPGCELGKTEVATAVVASSNVGWSTSVASSSTCGPSGPRSRSRTVTARGPVGVWSSEDEAAQAPRAVARTVSRHHAAARAKRDASGPVRGCDHASEGTRLIGTSRATTARSRRSKLRTRPPLRSAHAMTAASAYPRWRSP